MTLTDKSPRQKQRHHPEIHPSKHGGSPPLTPQQITSVSETRTLPFKQQRTRSPPPDPFEEDESPYFPHVNLSPFSQHESSSRPVSPEPTAPKHHRAGSPLHVETANQNHLSTDSLFDDELVLKRPCLDRPLPVPLQQHTETLQPPPPPLHADDTAPSNGSPRPRDWLEKSRKARKHWSQRHVWKMGNTRGVSEDILVHITLVW